MDKFSPAWSIGPQTELLWVRFSIKGRCLVQNRKKKKKQLPRLQVPQLL